MNDKKSQIAQKEEEIQAQWEKDKMFEAVLEKNKGGKYFSFYDGPPFATGLPHYGHILASVLKDTVLRYKTMRGFGARRVWGWDCHGLPIENMIEKEHGLKNKEDIIEFGIEKFNKAAHDSVLRYDKEWKKMIPRIGRWIDMENAYKTMDSNYTESVWWAFKTLYEKDLIYKGFKPMQICPRCETTLSNNEVSGGYKDITDISVIVKFQLENDPKKFVLAWTTTPWTLPGNAALALNPNEEYVEVESDGETYVLASVLLEKVFEGKEYKVSKKIKGKELVGLSYVPLFDYYSEDETLANKDNGWKIYGADFVTMEDGTGVVHIAPAFGEDDMNLGQKESLPFIQHVAMNGQMKKEVKDFAGVQAKPKDDHQATDVLIIKKLAEMKALFAKKKLVHSYPHCWRCETPLLNYAAESWFVKVTALREKLIAKNKETKWVPEGMRDGRFGNWLENARDWAISRSRFWGAPLPVWDCEKCGKQAVFGSRKEIAVVAKKSDEFFKDFDLHLPNIDTIKIECPCGGEMKRVPYVFDCWFESGSMPYAQFHYPFENQELFKRNYPADFIAEGLDQTRGWFYNMLVLGVALFEQAPFKNVIVNGLVLAEDGKKMSKSLNNYPDPKGVIDKYGADSLRYYLLSSPIVHAEYLSFSEKGVDEVLKKIEMRLLNVLTFYETFKDDDAKDLNSEDVLDKWMLARLKELASEETKGLETYELDRAYRPINGFIDDLSTWYLRRSRDRFKSDNEKERNEAQATTKKVLFETSKLLAPVMPFLAEQVYQAIGGKEKSVHLESWTSNESFVLTKDEEEILKDMTEVRGVVSLALEARVKAGIKVRQPLLKLTLKKNIKKDFYSLVADEVNVKEVVADEKLQEELLLDTNITEDLKREGQYRDLLRTIQEMRKQAKLTPEDLVSLNISTNEKGEKLVKDFENSLKNSAIIKEITFNKQEGEAQEIDGMPFVITINE